MKVLVTGSSGHLGEALVRTLRRSSHEVRGLDIVESPFTTHVGSITDAARVGACVAGTDVVLHTATLHKRVDLENVVSAHLLARSLPGTCSRSRRTHLAL